MGCLDCFKFQVHQVGLPCVVALMSCSLSLRQEALLQEHFQEVVLFLEGTKPGALAALRKPPCFQGPTRLIEIPSGISPDQLGAEQIASAIQAASNLG